MFGFSHLSLSTNFVKHRARSYWIIKRKPNIHVLTRGWVMEFPTLLQGWVSHFCTEGRGWAMRFLSTTFPNAPAHPPYTFWPVPKLCLHWASSPDIRRTCFSNLSLLHDCFARFSSIYPKEETLLKYLNRIICVKLCRADKRLLYRIHAFMK